MLALRCVYPCSLVGAVDLRFALCHADILLVWAEGVLRAQYDLPSVLHTSCRRHDVVVSVALVELCSLDGWLVLMSVVYYPRGACHTAAVGREGSHEEYRLYPRTRAGTAEREVCLAVVVPQRAAVNHSLALQHPLHRAPLSAGVLRLGHEEALVGVATVDVEPPVMIADGWRPDVVTVLHAAFPVEVCALILGQDRIVVGQSRTDKLPVDEVCAVENLQAGEAGEARRGHVIVIPNTADIRVRIVSVDNRIAVFPSADIGVPCL